MNTNTGPVFTPSPLTQLLANANANVNAGAQMALTPGLGLGPLPLPLPLPLPTFSGAGPLTGTGLSGTPGLGIGASPSYPFPGITPNTSAQLSAAIMNAAATATATTPNLLPGQGHVLGGSTTGNGVREMTLGDLHGALGELDRLLGRLQSFRREIEELQRSVFPTSAGADGGSLMIPPEQRLEGELKSLILYLSD